MLRSNAFRFLDDASKQATYAYDICMIQTIISNSRNIWSICLQYYKACLQCYMFTVLHIDSVTCLQCYKTCEECYRADDVVCLVAAIPRELALLTVMLCDDVTSGVWNAWGVCGRFLRNYCGQSQFARQVPLGCRHRYLPIFDQSLPALFTDMHAGLIKKTSFQYKQYIGNKRDPCIYLYNVIYRLTWKGDFVDMFLHTWLFFIWDMVHVRENILLHTSPILKLIYRKIISCPSPPPLRSPSLPPPIWCYVIPRFSHVYQSSPGCCWKCVPWLISMCVMRACLCLFPHGRYLDSPDVCESVCVTSSLPYVYVCVFWLLSMCLCVWCSWAPGAACETEGHVRHSGACSTQGMPHECIYGLGMIFQCKKAADMKLCACLCVAVKTSEKKKPGDADPEGHLYFSKRGMSPCLCVSKLVCICHARSQHHLHWYASNPPTLNPPTLGHWSKILVLCQGSFVHLSKRLVLCPGSFVHWSKRLVLCQGSFVHLSKRRVVMQSPRTTIKRLMHTEQMGRMA